MTIPVPIFASPIAAAAAMFIAVVGAWGSINSRLGKVESEILASRERTDLQFAAAEERALAREAAAEERAIARHEAAMAEIRAVEERAIARHNELLTEIRLWRAHGHDADGTIFFRVPE